MSAVNPRRGRVRCQDPRGEFWAPEARRPTESTASGASVTTSSPSGDPEDSTTDIYLTAALSVAPALAVRERASHEQSETSLREIERAVKEIEKQASRRSPAR